jgi:hypothetical protein
VGEDLADQLPDDTDALKQIITAMAQDAIAAQAEIAKLGFQLARYRRAEFGRTSEKLAREVARPDRSPGLDRQLELLRRGSSRPGFRACSRRESRRGARYRNTCRGRTWSISRRVAARRAPDQ